MPIAHSLRRLAASSIAILHTRTELVAVEVEEEAARYFSYLLLSLVAVFSIGIAFLLSVTLIVAIYWDTHRIESLFALILFFLLLAATLGWRVYSNYRRKPRLLDMTLSELSQDLDTFRQAGAHHGQANQ
ncbi:MAG: phage holin family protein [Herminiimonas sp.]|nr:phage holin family protein [Herminiimonas sp.]